MSEGIRCVVCGKILESDAAIVQVTTGKLSDGNPVLSKIWGHAHRSCFNRALPSPKAAIDEIRRLVKSQAA